MTTIARLDTISLPSGTAEKTITLDVHKTRSELLRAATSRAHDLTLELDVEAERSPDVFFEVALSAPKGKRHAVGNVALYGAGIRSEAHGEFHPAHVQLFISEAVTAALRNRSTQTLQVAFTARRADGERVRSASTLTIRNARIVAGPRLRD